VEAGKDDAERLFKVVGLRIIGLPGKTERKGVFGYDFSRASLLSFGDLWHLTF